MRCCLRGGLSAGSVNSDSWPIQWITDHIDAGNAIGKPVVLEEFAYKPAASRDAVYENWTYTVCSKGGAGWMYWILSGHIDDGTNYGGYDSYNVNETQPTYALLRTASANISAQKCGTPPPYRYVYTDALRDLDAHTNHSSRSGATALTRQ